jgi:hypothetical protein
MEHVQTLGVDGFCVYSLDIYMSNERKCILYALKNRYLLTFAWTPSDIQYIREGFLLNNIIYQQMDLGHN